MQKKFSSILDIFENISPLHSNRQVNCVHPVNKSPINADNYHMRATCTSCTSKYHHMHHFNNSSLTARQSFLTIHLPTHPPTAKPAQPTPPKNTTFVHSDLHTHTSCVIMNTDFIAKLFLKDGENKDSSLGMTANKKIPSMSLLSLSLFLYSLLFSSNSHLKKNNNNNNRNAEYLQQSVV